MFLKEKISRIYLERPSLLVIFLIIISTLIRFCVAAYTGLGIGEAYYFRGAKDIQWAYFDQPPMFFWIDHLFLRFMGVSNFSLRLPSVLFFAGSTWILYKITSRLYNNRAGFWSAVILNICLVFTIPIATWFQPDAPLIFFWLLTIYLLTLILELNCDHSDKRGLYLLWQLTGISLGLTFLSKYHALFIPLAMVIFMSLNKNNRKWLFHPAPYLALIPFIILITPVFLWNWQNHWISFTFQGTRTVGQFKIHPEWILRNIVGQIIWLAPWVFVPLFKEMLNLFNAFRKDEKKAFLFYLSILPIAFFTIISLWSDSKYHFHWQAPGYLVLMIPLGATLECRISVAGRSRFKALRWISFSGIVSVLVSAILLIHTETGFITKIFPMKFGPYVMKTDPTIEGYDYKDIKTRFDNEGWMNNDSLFIVSTSWWQSGKIDWSLKGKKNIIVLSKDPRNYAYYGTHPTLIKGTDAIMIRYFEENERDVEFSKFFETVTELNPIIIYRSKREELKLQVFYCHKFKLPDVPLPEYPAYRMMKGLPPF